jgi:hypothetical protein
MGKVTIVVSIVGVIAIAVIAGYIGGFIQWPAEPIATPTSTPSSLPVSPTPPTQPSSTSPAPTSSPSPNSSVSFGLEITGVSGSGLSRTVNADITNTGNMTTHNTLGKVEVYSQGSRVLLDGNEYITKEIGNISPGQTMAVQAILSFSFTDGIKISQDGARVVLTIIADEGTETFTYDYKP